MADIAITTYTNKIYKQGASTVVPGFIEGDPGSPVNPPGSGGASEFVPYVGAINDVDLGEKGLSTGYVTFDTTPTNTPTTQGTMSWDDSKETVALIMNGTTQRIGQDLYIYVKNSTGVDIDKGVNVGFAGTDGASGHILIKKFLADGSEPSYYYIGVTSEAIDNGDFGQVMIIGELSGINTSGYSPNPLLYASTTVAGAFQTTAPVAPNNIILVAAAVNFKNNGEIRIRPTFVSIGGSGTANYIPKFTGALSIGNSQIIDNGTNVLVNKTVDSGEKFQVDGTVLFSNTLTEIAGLNPTLRLKTSGNAFYVNFRKDSNEDAATVKFDDAVDEFAITTNVSNYPIRIEPHGTGNIKIPNVPTGVGDRLLLRDASNNLVRNPYPLSPPTSGQTGRLLRITDSGIDTPSYYTKSEPTITLNDGLGGGGATYTFTVTKYEALYYFGFIMLQIHLVNINTSGTPANTFTIDLGNLGIRDNNGLLQITTLTGSSMTDIDKIRLSQSSGRYLKFKKVDSTSDENAVTFSGGTLIISGIVAQTINPSV